MSKSSTAPDALGNRIDNFPDWLSPMLVKELRQGLRARGFVIGLILSQFLLILILLGSVADGSRQASGQAITGSLFWIFGILALGVQPLRGMNAISNDIKSKTLELMQLTRMNSTRIVLNKWLSLFAQTLLFATTLLPYFVLRYFFGGMDIGGNLIGLLTLLLFSGLFTAITVGISANRSVVVRGLIPVVGVPVLLIFGLQYLIRSFISPMGAGSGGISTGPMQFTALLTFCLYGGYLFLEMGAAVIAPIAENRQTRLRLVTFVFISLAAVLTSLIGGKIPMVMASSLLVIFGLIFLSSFLFLTPNTARSFLRFGAAGRLAGRILYPGWPAGLLFFLISAAMLVLCLPGPTSGANFQPLDQLLTFTGMICFALMVVELVARNSINRFAFLLLAMVSQAFMFFLCVILSNIGDNDMLALFFSLIPVCQLNAFNEVPGDTPEQVARVINGIYILATVVLAIARMGYYSKCERSAAELSQGKTETE